MVTDHCSMLYVAADGSEPVTGVVTGARRPLRVNVLVSPRPPIHGSASAICGNRKFGTSASRNTRSSMPFCSIAWMPAGRDGRTPACRSSRNHGRAGPLTKSRGRTAVAMGVMSLLSDLHGHQVRVLLGEHLQAEQCGLGDGRHGG